LAEVAVRAGLNILEEFEGNSVLNAGTPLGILGQQIRLHPIPLFNIIVVTLIT